MRLPGHRDLLDILDLPILKDLCGQWENIDKLAYSGLMCHGNPLGPMG